MNNSRMWLVVKPTVGIPMFLGAVAVGSFAVHVAVLSNTGWVSDFLSGNELGSTVAAAEATVQPASFEPGQATRVPVSALNDGFTFELPDGRTARVVIDQTY